MVAMEPTVEPLSMVAIGPRLSRCQEQPLNPSELPQTHHLSHAMTLTPFRRCCYSVAFTVIPTQEF